MIAILLYILPTTVLAQDEEGESAFYQKKKEGWFWYEDPVAEPEENPEKADAAQQVPRPPTDENRYRDASLEEYGIREMWNMYPDDFQELLNHIQNLAVQTPTEKNVLRYLVIQDIARRKALAYSNSAKFVTQKYGNLFNVNQVYPTAQPGVIAMGQLQQQEIMETIAKARKSHALIYFTSPDCGFCRKQDGILRYFIDKHGWQIKPVNILQSPDVATRFNIRNTPSLLLIKNHEEKYMTVAVGVVALSELESKLHRAIRFLNSDTGEQTFPMFDYQKGSAFDPTSILTEENQPWLTD